MPTPKDVYKRQLPYRPTTGFRYEVLTDDPSVRKQVDDMIFDFYGEEAPCRQEDHEPQPEPVSYTHLSTVPQIQCALGKRHTEGEKLY